MHKLVHSSLLHVSAADGDIDGATPKIRSIQIKHVLGMAVDHQNM